MRERVAMRRGALGWGVRACSALCFAAREACCLCFALVMLDIWGVMVLVLVLVVGLMVGLVVDGLGSGVDCSAVRFMLSGAG